MGSETLVVRRTRRALSEKRCVETEGNHIILVRHLAPNATRRALRLHALAEAGGVPVQKRQALQSSFTLRPFGWWHALRFEVGQTWHQARPDPVATRRLAMGLARLHVLQPPGGLLTGKRPGVLERAVIERSTTAIQNSSRLSAEERSALLNFVAREAGRLAPAEGYGLVHGDLHGLNIIVSPRGQIYFIDTESMATGLPLLEFAHALLNLFGKRNAPLRPVFVRNYLLRLSPAARAMWRQNAPALLMYARLVMAWRRQRRSRVLKRRGDHSGAAEAAHYYELFLADALVHLHRLRRAAEKRAMSPELGSHATMRKSPATGA